MCHIFPGFHFIIWLVKQFFECVNGESHLAVSQGSSIFPNTEPVGWIHRRSVQGGVQHLIRLQTALIDHWLQIRKEKE